jgi:hypothetical protein
MMKIYVASSWRNADQPWVVHKLRAHGHEVYDFRHHERFNKGFHWSHIDPDWKNWSMGQFRSQLGHELAVLGFNSDFDAMKWADTCVLVQPCGRSAHLEAGYFVGAGKTLIILLSDGEPELMYSMATHICASLDEVLAILESHGREPTQNTGQLGILNAESIDSSFYQG